MSRVRSIASRWGGPRRRCLVKSRPMVVAAGIGPRRLIGHRGGERNVPKVTKLAECPRLADAVEEKLSLWWSPGQISRWLVRAYPDDEGMRVSHETIYQSLFVQGRGALRKELWRSLRHRAGCAQSPQGRTKSTKGKIRDMVMISERPAEVEDRASSWSPQGDLIIGTGKSGYWDPRGTPNTVM